jgi:hypothetical protein
MQRNINSYRDSQHITVDLGPFTLIFLSEVILVLLKLLNYIQIPWLVVLSPILLLLLALVFIVVSVVIRAIKRHLF